MLSKWSFQSTAVTHERCSKPSVSFRYVHTGTSSARSITISTRRSRTTFASFNFEPKATFSCARTSFSAPGTDRPVIEGEDVTTALISGDLLLLERVLRGDEHDPEEQEDRELGHGRYRVQEAAPREGPEEEEDCSDVEDDENQREHVVLEVELDLRDAFRNLAALVGEVLQRGRVVGPEQTRREERAERKQQGNDSKNHDGHVAFQHHVRRLENWSGY